MFDIGGRWVVSGKDESLQKGARKEIDAVEACPNRSESDAGGLCDLRSSSSRSLAELSRVRSVRVSINYKSITKEDLLADHLHWSQIIVSGVQYGDDWGRRLSHYRPLVQSRARRFQSPGRSCREGGF